MKIKFQKTFASLLRPCLLAGIILIFSGCNTRETYPSKEDISQHLDPGCSLVSVEDFEPLPDEKGLKRIVFRYQADCIPNGGKIPIRIHASQQFNQYNDGGTTQWAAQELEYPPDPKAKVSDDTTGAAPPLPALPFSDAPNCNARVQRMVDEVLPCLNAQTPELAQQLQDLIEQHKTKARFHGQGADRGQWLLLIEQQCAEYWHQVNRQLPTGNAPGACALKD